MYWPSSILHVLLQRRTELCPHHLCGRQPDHPVVVVTVVVVVFGAASLPQSDVRLVAVGNRRSGTHMIINFAGNGIILSVAEKRSDYSSII